MDTNRLEAFSDGVIAVIITIMVLELKVPSGTDLNALWPMIPGFLIYLLSFVYVGIYWVNHHHLFKATHRINSFILWANLHLLFWLSLIPTTTAWSGHTQFAAAPSALYGSSCYCARSLGRSSRAQSLRVKVVNRQSVERLPVTGKEFSRS
jgi:uncharacterized membrane protein